MQYQRISNILESNSFFLFGARGTGKSTLIKKILPEAATLYIDLLKPTQERKLRDRPEDLAELAARK
jgi:predicted AAA+ superfamily ATPase